MWRSSTTMWLQEICGEDMVEKLRIKNVKTEEGKDLEGSRHLYRCRHPSQHRPAAGTGSSRGRQLYPCG